MFIVQKIRIIGFVCLVLLLSGCVKMIYAQTPKSVYDSIHIYTSKLQWAVDKTVEYPEESYVMLKESYAFFETRKDTARMISCLIYMSDIVRYKGKYASAFDDLWEALYLANETKATEQLTVVHRKLSLLYDLYDMVDISMQHLQSALDLSKQIYSTGENTAVQLNVSYLNLAVKKRKLGNYSQALAVLDSCILEKNVLEQITWFRTLYELERAKSFIELGQIQEAKESINIAIKYTQRKDVKSKVFILRRQGELMEKQNEVDSAIFYYNRSLRLMKTFNVKYQGKAEVLKSLSDLYFLRQKYSIAFSMLRQSKLIADSLSKARKQANSEIFKINNTYHEALQQKETMIEQRDKIIQNKSEVQLRLKIIIALLLLLIVAFVLVLRMRLRLRKTLLDKENTKLQAQLEKERNDTQMQLKSQELTSYALQLIDKESSVTELLQTIKELSPTDHKKLDGKYKTGAQSLWDEFNVRFTEVNTDFYERLTAKCPDLSRTEQKHCALIKLNFSTKEMAQILNVEGHTINMSRSRIRKKLGLSRSENLSSYISGI